MQSSETYSKQTTTQTSSFPQQQFDQRDTKKEIKESAHDAKQAVKDAAKDAKNSIDEAAHDAKKAVKNDKSSNFANEKFETKTVESKQVMKSL